MYYIIYNNININIKYNINFLYLVSFIQDLSQFKKKTFLACVIRFRLFVEESQ